MAVRWEDWRRLAGSDEFARYLMRARQRFEAGEAATVDEVRRVYRRAAVKVREDIARVASGTLRQQHLLALERLLEERARELTPRLLAATEAGIRLAVQEAVSGPQQITTDLFAATVLLDQRPQIRAMFADVNERAVTALLARTGKDGLKLSDRIWRVGEGWRNAARRLVEDAVARGEDARRLARDLQRYLQPGVFTALKAETRRRLKVPKDVSMEGMRLAVTEMQNAFHEGTVLANRATPSYQGSFWRLSNSHPIPDICDDYATHNGNGFWPKGQEPTKPHPWCRCVLIPAHQAPGEFVERLRGWMRDPGTEPGLELWYNEVGRRFLERPSILQQVGGTGPGGQGGGFSPLARALESFGVSGLAAREAENVGAIIRGLTQQTGVEYAAMVDAESGMGVGGILRGANASVDLRPHLQAMVQGHEYVHLHTHPASSAFSPEDAIIFARESQIRAMVAVGADGTWYVFGRVGATHPDAATIYKAFNDQVEAIRPKYEGLIRAGMKTADQAWREATHELWQTIATKMGFRYERVR